VVSILNMAAISSSDNEDEHCPWADVWPDCSPEDEVVQLRNGHSPRQVGVQVGVS